MGALSLGARGRWGAVIGIGEAFRGFVQYFWSLLEQTTVMNIRQRQSSTAESLIPYWVVRDRAVEILCTINFSYR